MNGRYIPTGKSQPGYPTTLSRKSVDETQQHSKRRITTFVEISSTGIVVEAPIPNDLACPDRRRSHQREENPRNSQHFQTKGREDRRCTTLTSQNLHYKYSLQHANVRDLHRGLSVDHRKKTQLKHREKARVRKNGRCAL